MIALVLALLSMLVIGSGCCVRATFPMVIKGGHDSEQNTKSERSPCPFFSLESYDNRRVHGEYNESYECHGIHLAPERERRQGTEVLELREERQNKKVIA